MESPLDIQAFARIAAHDLKAPMNGIASLVAFLREDHAERLGEAGCADLDLLERLALRGVALVDGLRTYACVAEAPLAHARLDMHALAARALDEVAARTTHGALTPGITTHLPAAAGDAPLVSTLLEQLLHNAVTFQRGPDRSVEVAAVAAPARAIPAGHTVYAVRDRGLGIAATHLEDIFGLFKRLHGPDAFGGRAGAGLAICRLIVERHGGVIWAESAEGRGSTFAFSLPAASPGTTPREP